MLGRAAPRAGRRTGLIPTGCGGPFPEAIPFAKALTAAALVVAGTGLARAETAAPNAAGTATTTTRRAPSSGAGAQGGNPPASSVGGGIIGSDAPARHGRPEAEGLSPAPSRAASGKA